MGGMTAQMVSYNPLGADGKLDLDLNRRDHRKLLVVDGAIAITGGVTGHPSCRAIEIADTFARGAPDVGRTRARVPAHVSGQVARRDRAATTDHRGFAWRVGAFGGYRSNAARAAKGRCLVGERAGVPGDAARAERRRARHRSGPGCSNRRRKSRIEIPRPPTTPALAMTSRPALSKTELAGRTGGPKFGATYIAPHGGQAAMARVAHDLLVRDAVLVRRGDEPRPPGAAPRTRSGAPRTGAWCGFRGDRRDQYGSCG
jgi:hypothetical protein